MESRSFGVVMRRLGHNRVALFDRERGRVDAVHYAADFRLCTRGALISYTLDIIRTRNRLQNVTLEETATHWVYNDFNFFCTVLELCFYSIGYGSSSYDIFDLVLQLYDTPIIKFSKDAKRLFLTRLFVLIGTHPDDPPCEAALFHRLISQTPKIMLGEEIPLSWCGAFDRWLQRCIQMHPRSEMFKVGFL